MAKQLFANNCSSLIQGISASDTSVIVAAGPWPVPTGGDWFLATLSAGGLVEIVKATANVSGTWTIERAQEGTAARAWPTGTVIEGRVTKGTLENFAQKTELSDVTGAAMVGYRHSLTAIASNVQNALRSYFSAWDYFTGISPVALAPIVGSIRNNGNGTTPYEFWKLIDYSGHAPVGFRNSAGPGIPIETTDAYIRVHHNIGGNITAGVIATVDETLAQTGIRLGTSVGENFTDIYMYRDMAGLLSRSMGGDWNVPFSNGIKTITWDAVNNYLVITHADCPNAAIDVDQQGGGEPGQWLAQATQVDKNTTRVYFVRAQGAVHSARIEWNGSAYAIVGNSQNIAINNYNTATGILTLDATNGDVFGYDAAVSAFATPYRPAITAAAGASISLSVYNTSNTLVTTSPDTNCKFIVRAQSRRVATQPSAGTNFAIRWNSRSQINPKSITAVDYPAGNLWVLGYTARV